MKKTKNEEKCSFNEAYFKYTIETLPRYLESLEWYAKSVKESVTYITEELKTRGIYIPPPDTDNKLKIVK